MNLINDILWTYILIAMLLGCAIWFTIKTRFVQFRMIGEMLRLLKDSAGKGEHGENIFLRSRPLPYHWQAVSVQEIWLA